MGWISFFTPHFWPKPWIFKKTYWAWFENQKNRNLKHTPFGELLGIFDGEIYDFCRIFCFSDLKINEILRIQNWILDSQNAETSHAVLGEKLGMFTSKEGFLLQKARKLGKFFSNELGRTFSLSFSPSRGKKYSFEANMPIFPPIPSFMPFGMENHNNHKWKYLRFTNVLNFSHR